MYVLTVSKQNLDSLTFFILSNLWQIIVKFSTKFSLCLRKKQDGSRACDSDVGGN